MSIGQDIAHLILRRLQGIATADENRYIETWANEATENRDTLSRLETKQMLKEDLGMWFDLMDTQQGIERLQRMEAHIRQSTADQSIKVKWIKRWLPYVAAAVLFVVATITWIVREGRVPDHRSQIDLAQNIQPGGNRATLTLVDGRTIDLSESQDGIVIGDESITYQDGSGVDLAASTRQADQLKTKVRIDKLSLSTPRGGQYQVALPDGTNVWLNAESTLRYPSRFAGGDRVVEIVGEAYFAVAKDRNRPFKVRSKGQIIEVLGTEFNIAAYPDEQDTKTTLVEGKVSVWPNGTPIDGDDAPRILLPGQQATVNASSVRVEKVAVNQYIIWKDGFFYFNGDSPQEAFARLSRWYDFELVYRGNIPTVQFFGKIERNKSLGSLLKILNKAGLESEVVPKGDKVQLIIGRE